MPDSEVVDLDQEVIRAGGPPWERLSPSSRNAFRYAAGTLWPRPVRETGLGTTTAVHRPPGKEDYTELPAITSEALLIGIMRAHENQPDDPVGLLLAYFGHTRDDLLREISEKVTPFLDERATYQQQLTGYPRVTANVIQILVVAEGLTVSADPPPTHIPLRFLFGGMLQANGGAYAALRGVLGDDVDFERVRRSYPIYLALGVQASYGDFLARNFRDTTLMPEEDWEEPGDVVAAGVANAASAAAGFNADDTVGDDALGRTELARQLARWLAAKNLGTPLATGLFGDWGSGKSFFMRQLGDEIRGLSKASGEASGQSAYCSGILQVDFNAWRHSDGQLWPSLAAQVFAEVAGRYSDADGRSSVTEKLQRQYVDEVQRESPQARRLHDLRQQEEAARKRVRESEAEIGKAATEKSEAIKELPESLRELAQTGQTLQAFLSALRTRQLWDAVRATWFSTVAIAVAAVAATMAIAVVASLQALVPKLAALGLIAAPVGAYLRAANSVVADWRKAQAKRDGLVRKAHEERDVLNQLTAAREEAEREFDVLGRFGGVWSYATGQASIWADREQLGVVSEIRRAFASLSQLIDQEIAATRTAGETPRIDRIVIYIDDLDRCQPAMVVRALEAIKLLMDLKHFVVIVGVDSRWLFRSLEINFKDLLQADVAGPDSAGARRAATPQSYLEKIFQFFLLLPPMADEDYAHLVSRLMPMEPEGGLTPAMPAATRARTESADATESVPDTSTDRRDGNAVVEAGEEPVLVASAPAQSATAPDLDPVDLRITAAELEAMQALAPLFDTPRTAKRLTNVYRLLRVMEGEAALLEDNAYERVLLLLALVVGFPRLSADLLRAIGVNLNHQWLEFVRLLEPKPLEGEPGVYGNALGVQMSQDEVWQWTSLRDRLFRLPSHNSARPMREFEPWVRKVGRFMLQTPWER